MWNAHNTLAHLRIFILRYTNVLIIIIIIINKVLGEEARLIYIVPVCYVKTGRYGNSFKKFQKTPDTRAVRTACRDGPS